MAYEEGGECDGRCDIATDGHSSRGALTEGGASLCLHGVVRHCHWFM